MEDDDEKNSDEMKHLQSSEVGKNGEILLESKLKKNEEDDDEQEEMDEKGDSEDSKRFKNFMLAMALTLYYVGTNVKLILDYSEAAEHDRYVRMTLAYMIAPIFITSLINLAWYIDDDFQAKDNNQKVATRKTWWLRGVFLLFQLGTMLRYAQAFVYSHKYKNCENRREKTSYIKKINILDRDITLLESFTGFMQGVPQYVLQLYILTQGHEMLLKDGPRWQILSMAGSIGMVSWAAVSCDLILGSATQNDKLSNWQAVALLVPWRLFSLTSRLTILGLFSTLFPIYFGLGCVAHYLIMYTLIQLQKVATHNGTRGEVFLLLVGGLVYIITDLLVKYERSYHKYLLYYSITFVEGVVMMAVWYVYSTIPPFYKYAIVIGVSSSFLLGMIFLRLFYVYNHPQHRKFCSSFCCSEHGNNFVGENTNSKA